MSRAFDGVDDRLVVSNGALGQVGNGALTLLVVAKPTSLGGGEAFISVQAGSYVALLYDNGSGALASGDAGYYDGTPMGVTAAAWQVLAVTKAAGSAQPRYHRAPVGGAWTHTSGGANWGGNATTATEVEFGSGRNGAFSSWKDYRLAVAAVWQGTALSDGDLETIVDATAQIDALSPSALWDFNQASTATAVTDLTGGGADQTTLVGTSVEADEPAGWTYGAGGGGGTADTYARVGGVWVPVDRVTRSGGAWV